MMDTQAIILDTNFWLLPFEHRINIVDGLEDLFEYAPFVILVPSPVIDELKMMAGKIGKKNSIAAKSALELIENLIVQKKAMIVEQRGKADGVIITLALQKKAWVATNDRPLRFRLKNRGIKTVILKDKHAVVFA